jgi:excisionase family DNA binding protein
MHPVRVAEMLGISKRTVYRMIKDGRLASVTVFAVYPCMKLLMVKKDSLMNQNVYRKAIKPKDAAARLGVSASTIYRWFHEGVISGFKVASADNGPVRIFEDEIDRLMDINTCQPRELRYKQHG